MRVVLSLACCWFLSMVVEGSKRASFPKKKLSYLNTGSIRRRDLKKGDEREWEPLRIRWKLLQEPTATVATTSNNNWLVNKLSNEILPEMQEEMMEIFKVTKVEERLVNIPDACGLVNGTTPMNFLNKNLLILVGLESSSSSSWCSDGVLALASPCLLHPDTHRPVVGFIHICDTNNFDNDGDDAMTALRDNIRHEIIHVLGFASPLFPYYTDAQTGQLLTTNTTNTMTNTNNKEVPCAGPLSSKRMYQDADTPIPMTILKPLIENDWVSYTITLPTVTQVLKNHFDCDSSAVGGHLENYPAHESDCFGSHWDERYHTVSLMSAVYDTPHLIYFSPLTLALLEDSGWYRADYTKAQISTYGLNAGCSFLTQPCIVDNNVPPSSRGYFCNTLATQQKKYCNPTANGIGICDLSSNMNPLISYFPSNPDWGVNYPLADFCPRIFTPPSQTELLCPPQTSCLTISSNNNDDDETPFCATMTCQPSNLTISVYLQTYSLVVSCQYDFQILPIPNHPEKSITCPRLSTICPEMMTCPSLCSGKGTCDKTTRKCSCFDPSDTSEGCYHSAPQSPSSKVNDEWNNFIIPNNNTTTSKSTPTSKSTLSLSLVHVAFVLIPYLW